MTIAAGGWQVGYQEDGVMHFDNLIGLAIEPAEPRGGIPPDHASQHEMYPVTPQGIVKKCGQWLLKSPDGRLYVNPGWMDGHVEFFSAESEAEVLACWNKLNGMSGGQVAQVSN
jgi:hypothetical protein